MSDRVPLRQQLKFTTDLCFPGFEKHSDVRAQTSKAYAFEKVDGLSWYCKFRQRVLRALSDRMFLPVYRMCDGEFLFALGRKPGDSQVGYRLILDRVRTLIARRLSKRGGHQSGSTVYGYEQYSPEELVKARQMFITRLKFVAEKGILAIALHNSALCQPYIPAILDWFDMNQVGLHSHNYFHFYKIYALMHGPDRFDLLKDRRVLVITGLTKAKRLGIESGLRRIGVANVQFIPISSSKSMLEIVDLSKLTGPVDVALVGAGVGSVNVLAQLEPLNTACLDVGFALSTLANPELRWKRPFCVPDEEFDPHRIRWTR